MTQFDELATPMYNSFTSAAGHVRGRGAAGNLLIWRPAIPKGPWRQRVAQAGFFGFRPRRSGRVEPDSLGSTEAGERDAGAGPQRPPGLALIVGQTIVFCRLSFLRKLVKRRGELCPIVPPSSLTPPISAQRILFSRAPITGNFPPASDRPPLCRASYTAATSRPVTR